MRNTFATITLGIGVAVAVALLMIRAHSTLSIVHDDAITFLAATCHQGDYASDIPAAQWVPASRWQAYWKLDRFGCFTTISQDLARYDIHPPLYFWIVHIWFYLIGSSQYTAFVLNAILHALTSLTVYATCRTLFCGTDASVLAAVLWALSVSSLSVPMFTRQYSLLGLFVTLYFLALMAFLRKREIGSLPYLYLFAVAGLLTHYHFLMVLLISVFWTFFALLISGNKRSAICVALVVVAALVTAAFIHPHFMNSFRRQQVQAQEVDWAESRLRLKIFLASLVQLQLTQEWTEWIIQKLSNNWRNPLILSLISLGLFVFGIARNRLRFCGAKLSSIYWIPSLTALSTVLSIGFLYVLGMSPRHAIGGRYVVLFSPLLYIALGQVFDRTPKGFSRTALFGLAISLQVSYAGIATIDYIQSGHREIPPALAGGAPIILDSVARGVLPTYLWNTDGQTQVYATSQDQLLRIPLTLRNPTPILIYVSDQRYGNTQEKSAAILARLEAQNYGVVDAARFPHGGIVYTLQMMDGLNTLP